MKKGHQTEQNDYTVPNGYGVIRNAGVMQYRTRTIKSGDYLECEMFPVLEPVRARAKRSNGTTEAMQKINRKNAVRKLERLMHCNFQQGDLFLTLTHRDGTDEIRAKKDIDNYIRKLKRRAAKKGKTLKYIYVAESSERDGVVRWHVHMIMVAGIVSREEAEQLWGHGVVTQSVVRMDSNGLKGLAAYMTKSKQTQEKLMKRRWAASQGLKQPQVTESNSRFSRAAVAKIVKSIEQEGKKEIEKRYPGYKVLEDVEIRFSDYFPGAYVYAFMRRTE